MHSHGVKARLSNSGMDDVINLPGLGAERGAGSDRPERRLSVAVARPISASAPQSPHLLWLSCKIRHKSSPPSIERAHVPLGKFSSHDHALQRKRSCLHFHRVEFYRDSDNSYHSSGLFKDFPHKISRVRRLLHSYRLCAFYTAYYSRKKKQLTIAYS